MKAVICPKYGPPEVLQIVQVPTPKPGDNEVLVRIHSTAVNSGDVRVRGLQVQGFMKFVMRVVLGFKGPRKKILGTVFSGVVVETGKSVTKFKTGDEVFGMTGFSFGTYAEYIALAETAYVIHKPVNASFDEAAAIPFGGQTAIHFLEKAGITAMTSPSVLIIGATGSVGTAAVQIAKHYKADVTAVCSSRGTDLVKSLGVQNIILYDKEDLRSHAQQYDIIFDAIGKTTKSECRHLLKPGGIFKTVGGLEVASETREQVELLRLLFEKGRYQATIDKVFSLDEIVAAHRYVETGRKKGNVVVRIVE